MSERILIRKNIMEIESIPLFLGGSEGEISKVDEGIMKRFWPNTSKSVIESKVRKLEYVHQRKSLDPYHPKLYYLVMDVLSEYIIAYVMEEIKGKTFEGFHFNQRDLIKILRKIKQIVLEEFYQKEEITYVDLRKPNIRIDENLNPIFLDFDSIIIPTEKEALLPTSLFRYQANGGKIDIHALIMMINEISIHFLRYEDPILDKEGREFLELEDFYMPNTIVDHEFYIDHVKEYKNERK